MSKLVIRGLRKAYDKIKAVDDFSIEIENGELLAILGPSGCGKSTLLSCLAGIEDIQAGFIELDGKCLLDTKTGVFIPPENRDIGFVFQNYALWPHMSVEANVSYPLRMRRLPKGFIKLEVEHILGLMHLEDKKRKYPSQLSGGEQQRVALGRALVMKPSLLLLDEPLSNLDAKLREQMQTEIRTIQQKLGVTTIHVTHDQSEAMAMSDRIAVMANGKLIQTGNPSEIYDRPSSLFTANFMGINNLIEGLINTDNGKSVFISNNSERFRVSADQCNLCSAQPIFCIIRPEDIKISKSADNGGLISAAVTDRIYKGAHFLYTIDVDGLKLKVLTHSSEVFELRTRVFIRIIKYVYLPVQC